MICVPTHSTQMQKFNSIFSLVSKELFTILENINFSFCDKKKNNLYISEYTRIFLHDANLFNCGLMFDAELHLDLFDYLDKGKYL